MAIECKTIITFRVVAAGAPRYHQRISVKSEKGKGGKGKGE
jgi:hypothetical protein